MSSSSSSSSSSRPKYGLSKYARPAAPLSYPKFDDYLPEGYKDPTMQQLENIGIGAADLPHGYNKLPNLSPPSRLYELPRQRIFKPLSEAELKLARQYEAGFHNPASKYLVDAPVHLSRAERKTETEKRKKARSERLEKLFPTTSERDEARRAFTKMNQIRAQEDRMRIWNERLATPEDYQAMQRSMVMRNVARKLPASITDSRLVDILKQESIRGKSRTQLPQQLANMFDPDVVGSTPQSMDAETRNLWMLRFGELVDVLHVHPVFDPRLTTVESASQVFNPDDYDISIYDLDDNVLTPGTVIVTTKFSTRNAEGEVIPPGQIVAIGGYKMLNPNSSRTLSQLQRMAYYQANPTRTQRANIPFNDWKREQKEFKTPAAKANGLKAISRFIRDYWEAQSEILPERTKVDGKYQEMPAFMVFECARMNAASSSTSSSSSSSDVVSIYYKVSSVVMNTILSRMAELYFNMIIAPMIFEVYAIDYAGYDRTKGVDPMGEFIEACDTQIPCKWCGYESFMDNTVITPLIMNKKMPPLLMMYIGWPQSYFHPKALAKFLSYTPIKESIPEALVQSGKLLEGKKRIGDNSFDKVISTLLDIVMIFTMNSNIEGVLDNIAGEAIDGSNSTDVMLHIATHGGFRFCNKDEVDVIIEHYRDSGNTKNIINLTARAWDKDVRIMYKLSERGSNKLADIYQKQYEGATIALGNPELYIAGRAARAQRLGTAPQLSETTERLLTPPLDDAMTEEDLKATKDEE